MPVYRVLEPSCGDGRIMDELRARNCSVLGFEYHAARAAEARAKGHPVVNANFLEQTPKPEFDKVVMNPPFYGRHYVKHVRHALKFLKPGGSLVSILPATAHYDHGELSGEWRDLPVASFADAGTNIPTGLMRIRSLAA
jgi:SAM-dependent methyltransferase